MLSLIQQKQLFNNKQLNHLALSKGTFLFDDISNIGASEEVQYPLMNVEVGDAILNGNLLTQNYDISFLDLVHLDDTNKDEVLSNMLQTALDVISQIESDIENIYQGTVNITFNFENRVHITNDRVSGWGLQIGIEQFYDKSKCLIPDSGVHAGAVIIYNSDGSIAAILYPGSSYTLTSMATDTADTNTSFTGTAFNLSHTPVFITGVFLNGQRLTLTTDYTIVGTVITFNNALANDIVVVVYSY